LITKVELDHSDSNIALVISSTICVAGVTILRLSSLKVKS